MCLKFLGSVSIRQPAVSFNSGESQDMAMEVGV